MKSSRGLTLLEAVIVIGVVVLFLALLFPPMNTGPAPRAQAKNDVTQIATAVAAYETEYGHPLATKQGVVGGELLATLMGSNSPLNPRGLVFIEVNYVTNVGRSGMNTNGDFVDPWGERYRIAFATGTNNWVMAGTNSAKISKRVAVWNDPRLELINASVDPKKLARHYVNSWD